MRVLLIEDEPTTAKSIELMLSGPRKTSFAAPAGDESNEMVFLNLSAATGAAATSDVQG